MILKNKLKNYFLSVKKNVVFENDVGYQSWCDIVLFCSKNSEIKKKNYRPFKDIAEFIKYEPKLMIPRKGYYPVNFYRYNQSDKTISVGGIDYCTFKDMFDDEYAKISYDGLNWKRFGIEVKE